MPSPGGVGGREEGGGGGGVCVWAGGLRFYTVVGRLLYSSTPAFTLSPSHPQVHAHSVLSCGRSFDEDQVLLPFIGHALSCLWADPGVRAAAARGYEYELNDSAL